MFYDHTIIVLYYVFMFNVLRRCLYVSHIVQLHMLFVFRITQIILFSVLYINFVDSIYSNLNKKHVSLIIIRLLYSTYFMAYNYYHSFTMDQQLYLCDMLLCSDIPECFGASRWRVAVLARIQGPYA